jgi:hypothetical protein
MKLRYLFIYLFLPVLAYTQDAPKFMVDGGFNIDLGKYQRGKEVVYNVEFKNTGKSDLKINQVTTTCGCSSALVSSDVLKPGETGIIKFTFNGMSMGIVTKSIDVVTNEPTDNVHRINITMNMIDPVAINPAFIISSGKVGEEVFQSISIQNNDELPITIDELTSNSPAVKVEGELKSLNNGENEIIKVTIKIYEDSPVNAAVIIKTSAGEFQVPITVDVTAR